MPISFVLAMFVLPLAIIALAVVLASIGRQPDGSGTESEQ